jgi:hypothetical protein
MKTYNSKDWLILLLILCAFVLSAWLAEFNNPCSVFSDLQGDCRG